METKLLFANLSTNEPSILDPLTTIIKIAMLYFQPHGTKLNFSKYSMGYDPPTFFQGIIRSKNSSSRNDITILKKVIDFFLRCYNIENNDHLQLTIKCAIKGLEKLSDCYPDESPIDHCLQFYTDTLYKHLNEKKDIDVDAKRMDNSIDIFKRDLDEEDKKVIDNYFKDLWSVSQLSIITAILIEMNNQLNKTDSASNKELSSYINSINSMLYIKDVDLEKFILKNLKIENLF